MHWILTITTIAMASTAAYSQDDEGDKPYVVKVHRYLGFRQVKDISWDSDYGFTLLEDGSWQYQSTVGNLAMHGKSDRDMTELGSQIAQMLADQKGAGKQLDHIADAPAMTVQWHDDGEQQAKLSPRSELAMHLHDAIQQWIQNDAERIFLATFEPARDQVRVGRQPFGEPTIITSAQMLAEQISDEDLRARIESLADFDTSQVLLFAWSGSGQDRLAGKLTVGQQPPIEFHYSQGRTRDLRPHSRVFVIPKEAQWQVVR